MGSGGPPEADDQPISAIGRPHAAITNRLVRAFAGSVAEGIAFLGVGARNPSRGEEPDEPDPDLELLRPPADDYRTSHPTASDVLHVVEVAGSWLVDVRGVELPSMRSGWIKDIAYAATWHYHARNDGAHAVRSDTPGIALAVPGWLSCLMVAPRRDHDGTTASRL